MNSITLTRRVRRLGPLDNTHTPTHTYTITHTHTHTHTHTQFRNSGREMAQIPECIAEVCVRSTKLQIGGLASEWTDPVGPNTHC